KRDNACFAVRANPKASSSSSGLGRARAAGIPAFHPRITSPHYIPAFHPAYYWGVKPKHPRAAGAVVFRRTDSGVRLLVLRAYKNWDFPKGMVDPGESQLDAAKREVAEETGLYDLEYPFGEEFKETLPYSTNKVARYYLAETTEHDIELPVSPELK